MIEHNRDTLRQQYVISWKKFQQNVTLTPLEQQIVAVIKEHPEYHSLLQMADKAIQMEYSPEMGQSNPFLHLGMHLGLREQISTNRPVGIIDIYHRLTQQYGTHEAEHIMMECLAEAIWQAQRNQTIPNETVYLQCLKTIK